MITQPTAEVLIRKIPSELHFAVSEIFHSLQGEGLRAGLRCVFVRLHGCKLRCSWCDTPYALDHRKPEHSMAGDEIIKEVQKYDCNFVEFTGGEPLEQHNVFPLMKWFCDNGYTVAVETGGHINTEFTDSRVIRIIDMKAPDSNMTSLNNYHNLEILNSHDEVKFVLASRKDYEWAVDLCEKYQITKKCAAVLFSCVFGSLEFRTLAEWILSDRLDVRMQLQIHKFIWEPNQRGV
ncbi:MAG: 4Fe-4S cluster-binding domain-containing protein [Ignavibacteriae bacterium]|nr:4Fe-4S cluster-binding domain-containing protein [Ignavibacteriota bacterium]